MNHSFIINSEYSLSCLTNGSVTVGRIDFVQRGQFGSVLVCKNAQAIRKYHCSGNYIRTKVRKKLVIVSNGNYLK